MLYWSLIALVVALFGAALILCGLVGATATIVKGATGLALAFFLILFLLSLISREPKTAG